MLASAVEYNVAQERLIAAGVATALRSSWERSLILITGLQLAVAREAMAGFRSMLAEQGAESAVVVSAAPLLGLAGNGHPLRDYADADLARLFTTALQDTARQVTAAAMAAEPKVTGYVRQTDGNACARCIILAGRIYRKNTGFARHPRCGCSHAPIVQGSKVTPQSPQDVFDGLSREEQDRRFGKAGAESIRMGADMGRVVNARSGIQKVQLHGQQALITTAGRRASGGYPRLMPETILAHADNREHAVALLRHYGYIL